MRLNGYAVTRLACWVWVSSPRRGPCCVGRTLHSRRRCHSDDPNRLSTRGTRWRRDIRPRAHVAGAGDADRGGRRPRYVLATILNMIIKWTGRSTASSCRGRNGYAARSRRGDLDDANFFIGLPRQRVLWFVLRDQAARWRARGVQKPRFKKPRSNLSREPPIC
jgi:hypothetical protein